MKEQTYGWYPSAKDVYIDRRMGAPNAYRKFTNHNCCNMFDSMFNCFFVASITTDVSFIVNA